MCSRVTSLVVVGCLGAAVSVATTAPAQIGRDDSTAAERALPDPLPAEPQVKDPVFSVLLGLIHADLYGSLTRERLERALSTDRRRSRLPYERLKELTRVPDAGGRTSRVTLVFDGALELPIPYRILWYRPGSVLATETCLFREWRLGALSLPGPRTADNAPPEAVHLDDVHLFALRGGQLDVDIDGWLDRLMGGRLDDTRVNGIVLMRWKGRWLGLAIGHNRDGRARSGTFDFTDDRILFPSPAELKAVARHMRSRIASLVAADAPLAHGR